MVDDYDRRDRRKEGRQFSQKVGLKKDDDVPAKRNNPLRQQEEGVLRSMIDKALQEVEPDPAYPVGVEPGQFRIGDRPINHRDAARRPVRPGDAVERGGVVGAVAACLDDHVARETESVAKREQHLGRRILRQILRLRTEWKARLGSEDMDVRVDRRQRRRPSRRRRRIGP